MDIEIRQHSAEILSEYVKIPISFSVESYYQIRLLNSGLDGIKLTEKEILKPYDKDYDIINPPIKWAERFDTTDWVFLIAYTDDIITGGTILVHSSSDINLLEGRNDLAVLWDIRVSPKYRGMGIGKSLFNSAVARAKEKDCSQLKIETQNTNVKACKFYAKQGCDLGLVNRFAYEDNPDVMLCWYYNL